VVDDVHDLVGVQTRVLVVAWVADFECDLSRKAIREIRSRSVLKGQELLARLQVRFRVVALDEGPCPAYQVQPHQVSPVIRIFTLLEGSQGPHGALVSADKLGFT
jgi:hypothetical protein